METVIVNGTLIVGDGETIIPEGSLILDDEIIRQVVPLKYIAYSVSDHVIDARGGYVLPGVINTHAHGLTTGPFFPYAYPPLSWERVNENLDTHLRNGTTTILDLDGFNTPWEVDLANKRHPMRVKTATSHTPLNVKASKLINGKGLKEKHLRLTPEEMAKAGAVAIGEIGSPGTLYATSEMRARLGKEISIPQAGAIIRTFQGNLKPGRSEIKEMISEWELEGIIDVDDAEELYRDCYERPLKASQDAILEAIEYSKKLNLPASLHNSPQTKDEVLAAAKELGPMMIALHTNYMFNSEEALELAKEIKRYGGWVEVITGDMLGAKQQYKTTEGTFMLLREGVVDLISTDFSGGYADPILYFIDVAVKEGVIGLAQGVAMCTWNPAKAIPGVAVDRGVLEEGKIADICITEPGNLSRVRCVLIGGEIVFNNK